MPRKFKRAQLNQVREALNQQKEEELELKKEEESADEEEQLSKEDVKKLFKESKNSQLYKTGGLVLDVPNVSEEPDQRIDKTTGLPYDMQAQGAFIDAEDRSQRARFSVGSQVGSKIVSPFIEFLSKIYADLGFKEFDIKLSTRPEMRVGSDEIWDKAEEALEAAIKNLGYPYRIDEGDGAFYGPKLDFVLTDAIGREWQCGTFQLDFNLAERLDATYIGEDGKKHIPVMIHRAVLGSFERFIGILIENYAGKLPFWLAPQQVVIASIVSDANDYALEIQQSLKDNKIRCEVDLRNEKISYKVREHSTKKVPIILAIGKKEMADKTVSLRRIGSKESLVLSLDDAIKDIIKTVEGFKRNILPYLGKNKEKPMYDGRSRKKNLEYEGKNVLRYKMPDASTSFKDLILGDISVENKELDDFIILRADGTPTYNFCAAVDDLDMKISPEINNRIDMAMKITTDEITKAQKFREKLKVEIDKSLPKEIITESMMKKYFDVMIPTLSLIHI